MFSKADNWTANYAHTITYIHVRGVVDAIAFSQGTGLRLWVEECIFPDGSRVNMRFGNPQLKELLSFDEVEVFAAVEKERRLMKPLNDLTECLFNPTDSFVNCQRAIEGIGHLMSADPERKKRWGYLRDSLNINREYLDFVVDRSKAGRHGQAEPINMRDAGETQLRAWTILNRFLAYRKNGGVPLTAPEFPRL